MKDADTKTRILDAAEKLFASNGFGAVSLRAIIKEAGVNTASVHYHFGSKGGLMEAVLRRRAAPMNTERLRLLDGIESNHPTGVLPIEEVIEAFLAPAIRRHRGPARDRGLLPRLMGRAITEPDQVVSKAIRKIFEEVFERFSAAFARALPELSV
ncbi:MAG: TetR/AcrR family transcriptional regulator, partial [Candidatus Latescibacterota bacterium]